MKRFLTCILVAMIAFSAFAAVNVTIDTITMFSGAGDPQGLIQKGFVIGGADEAIMADINFSLSSSYGSALVNIRAEMPSSKYNGASVSIHGWEVNAKLNDWATLSLGNTAVELFNESISWEPVFGAGLFESMRNRLYFDLDVGSDIEVIVGISPKNYATNPLKTLQLAAIYDVPMLMKVAAEFWMVPDNLCQTMYGDGEVKAISVQLDYVEIENTNLLLGYTAFLAEGALVQNRIDLLASYTPEGFEFEVYDALLLRMYSGTHTGNRFAAKATYYATEKLAPSVSFNWFKNYGYNGESGFAWSDCQLCDAIANGSLFIIEPRLGFTVSDNTSGYLGAQFKFDATPEAASKSFWSLQLGLTATF